MSPMGLGTIESGIKPTERRDNISGAQLQVDNVPLILPVGCASLNGTVS